MSRIWKGILTLDRVLRIVPSLIQVWLVEYFLIIPLAFFIAKIVDIRGTARYPGTGERLDGTMWTALAISSACGFFFVKNLVAPRVRYETWTPTARSGPIVGDLQVIVPNTRATVEYPFLSSHPAYALLLLPTAWLPLMMLEATKNLGGNSLYWRAAGYAGLAIIAVIALLRLTCWYVLGIGQAPLDKWVTAHSQLSPRRVGWEMAWRPTLILVGFMHAAVFIPLGLMFYNEGRTITALPLVRAEMAADASPPHMFGSDAPRKWVRVEGRIVGKSVLWPATGENRGGDNYRGAGIVVALDTGGEALVLAESMGVPDLIGDLQRAKRTGRFASSGYVVNAVSETQTTYYGFRLEDCPPPDTAGRVLVIHGYP